MSREETSNKGAAWVSAVGVAALTTACGGGGKKPNDPKNNAQGLTPQCAAQPAQAAATPVNPAGPLPAPTYEMASRFLAQIGLGATIPDVKQIVETDRNYTIWLNARLNDPLPGPTVFDWAKEKGFAGEGNFGTDRGVDNALWSRLLGRPDVVRQRMALAWSQIFVVSSSNMATPWGQFAAMAYWDILEAQGLGNFRTLLKAITLSTAMGVYLNMRGSRKADAVTQRQPDENYAREILQLFTIGLNQLRPDGSEVLNSSGKPVPNYSNEDISGLASVFTGWDFDRFSEAVPDHLARPMIHNSADFSEGSKSFLGATIGADKNGEQALDAALDVIFQHPNVPPFISRRLIQQLVTSNPSPAYIARVSGIFANNGLGVRGDIKAVIRAIVLDPEARPPLTSTAGLVYHGKLREPVLRLVHWARLFDVQSTDGKWLVPNLATTTALGQSPLRAPSVFNFYRPGYVPPNSELTCQGMVAPEFQITDDATVIAYANFMQTVIGFGADQVEPNYDRIRLPRSLMNWDDLAATPVELVAWLNTALTGGALLPENITMILSAVESITQLDAAIHPVDTPTGSHFVTGRRARVLIAVYLILCSPDFLVQR
ncbi:DUF1800 family protein [Aquabacterium sp. CECT 9606]|uniref:DUF1800 domain-containing protein n=1 Tax=Aquabacterium sp. CECT 9606 TaxID=2845822 RepID=UPI001E2B8D5C|nr:DUF1800 domain-containing protein [Aquabacterium sp. CECT 9606]CAH0350310.1 hypothetical protein AQB9606_01512 [Aquabacterium sp. CECT 9606]